MLIIRYHPGGVKYIIDECLHLLGTLEHDNEGVSGTKSRH